MISTHYWHRMYQWARMGNMEIAYEYAAKAFEMAQRENELPDTEQQRWCAERGACLEGRERLGAMTFQEFADSDTWCDSDLEWLAEEGNTDNNYDALEAAESRGFYPERDEEDEEDEEESDGY